MVGRGKLDGIKMRIEPLFIQQLLVLADFLNLSVFHNNDLVGTDDGGQTMRHNKRSTPLHQLIKRLLNIFLALSIQQIGRASCRERV